MKSPRVNLLKKNEQRYQGAVSRRFIMVSLVITPIVLVAVLSTVKLVQYTGIQAQLKASRAIWADLEPRVELYKSEQSGLTANRKIMDVLDSWKRAQGSFALLLDEIRDDVPENIQISHLSIRGTLASSLYAEPEDAAINYSMSIEGISQGDLAEKQVIRLQKDLLDSKHVSSAFATLKLASMRKNSRRGDVKIREFRLEGENPEGGEK